MSVLNDNKLLSCDKTIVSANKPNVNNFLLLYDKKLLLDKIIIF